jgi:hypothetical protein
MLQLGVAPSCHLHILISCYSLYSDLPITVEVHDYYGQLASGEATLLSSKHERCMPALAAQQA